MRRRTSDLSVALASLALTVAAAAAVGASAMSSGLRPVVVTGAIPAPAAVVPVPTAVPTAVPSDNPWASASSVVAAPLPALPRLASAAPRAVVDPPAVPARPASPVAVHHSSAPAAAPEPVKAAGKPAKVAKVPAAVKVAAAPAAVAPAVVAAPGAMPGPGNTGPHGPLRPVGSMTISAPGVYSGLDVHGHIDVTAPNVTISNVRVDASDAPYAIRNLSSGHITITDCDLGPSTPGHATDAAVVYNDYTLLPCNIHDTEDGLKAHGNTDIEDNWLHDTFEDNGNHSDGIQVSAGSHVIIRHNTIQQFPRDTSETLHQGVSCIMVKSDQGDIDDVQILDNQLTGYVGFLLYDRAGTGGHPTPTNVVISGNSFGPQDPAGATTGWIYGTLSADSAGPSLSDNTTG
jgi:hypothetical protein